MKLLQEVNDWEVIDKLKNGHHVYEFDTLTENVCDLWYCSFHNIMECIKNENMVFFMVYDND